VKNIRRATRRHFSDKVHIVLRLPHALYRVPETRTRYYPLVRSLILQATERLKKPISHKPLCGHCSCKRIRKNAAGSRNGKTVKLKEKLYRLAPGNAVAAGSARRTRAAVPLAAEPACGCLSAHLTYLRRLTHWAHWATGRGRLDYQQNAESRHRIVSEPDASMTKTQSPSPERLFPGGLNFLLPALANGEPSMSAYSPFVGSYQRAVAMDASFDISTVIVRMVGR
jgi:hypothetical protein